MAAPENQNKPKSRRGGLRNPPGGRPTTAATAAKREIASRVLAGINEEQAWAELATSDNEKVRLGALIYLTDREYGKAPQTVKVDTEAPSVDRLAALLERLGVR